MVQDAPAPAEEEKATNLPAIFRKGSFQRPTHLEEYGNELDPAMILHNPHFNKFTAFTLAERERFGLRGLLPWVYEDIEKQAKRCYAQYSRFTVPLSKYIYLASLRDRNDCLFYKLVIEHLEEMLPIIYTPTVGQVCLEFGHLTRQAEGMTFCPEDAGQMMRMLDNWRPNSKSEVAIIVVSDGSRILGLGDLGACGMGIPIGKLSLYVAAGGFHPATILPVILDTGTNNERLLNDEFYLGQRHKRLKDDDYYRLVDEFLMAVKSKWPKALVQFEDFSNDHCFTLLENYRTKLLCFNDDIQGTGCVIAAGFLNSLKLAGVLTYNDIKDKKIVMVGAGSAGTGVAQQICRVLKKRYAMSDTEARQMFYLMDSRGLVFSSRGDKLAPFKVPFARADINGPITNIKELVELVRPIALIGLSCTPGIFTEEILKHMAQINERPIVFALSNPTSKSECSFETAVKSTNGQVIFASGSPYDNVSYNGKVHSAAQGNNLYCFPGIGFGSYLAQARQVSDCMIDAAAFALADIVTPEMLQNGMLYPRLNEVRKVSARIAVAVIQQAKADGLSRASLSVWDDDAVLQRLVESCMYEPKYLESQYIDDKESLASDLSEGEVEV